MYAASRICHLSKESNCMGFVICMVKGSEATLGLRDMSLILVAITAIAGVAKVVTAKTVLSRFFWCGVLLTCPIMAYRMTTVPLGQRYQRQRAEEHQQLTRTVQKCFPASRGFTVKPEDVRDDQAVVGANGERLTVTYSSSAGHITYAGDASPTTARCLKGVT